jgi:predicted flap endonuclease-1-like 5' DNA nuclease
VASERNSRIQSLELRLAEVEAKRGLSRTSRTDSGRERAGPREKATQPPADASSAGTSKPAADNLKRIEGIGPKISGLLQAAGIVTFAQLASADVSALRGLLREAGLTLADPGTWPEQAQLAAAGEWDAFNVLQRELKGGRRV